MKNLLTVVVLFLTVLNVKGQISFQDTTRMNSDTTNAASVSFVVTNTTADTVKVNWRRTVNDTATWGGTSICDLNICYQNYQFACPIPSVFLPNSSGPFIVNFNPYDRPGTGHVQLTMTIVGMPSFSKTADVYLTESPLAAIKQVDEESIKVYPNPVLDYLLIQNKQNQPLSHLELYSMLGRKVLAQKIDPMESMSRIDMSDVPKGIYMLRLFDESNNVVLTKSISRIR